MDSRGEAPIACTLGSGDYRVIVAGSWLADRTPESPSARSPARATVYVMTLATAVLLLAVLWPRIEPHVIGAVTQR